MARAHYLLLSVLCLSQLAVALADESAASTLKLAAVDVASAKSVELTDDKNWSGLPDFLKGAKIFSDSPEGRDLQAQAKSDGIVVVAASWTYDGNESGGWYEDRTTPELMGERGWTLLGEIVWKEKDKHQLYFRTVKAGEKILFHTRKYNQPFLVLPDAAIVAAHAKTFQSKPPIKAVAKAETPSEPKPVPAEPKPVPLNPSPAAPTSLPVPKEIEMAGPQVSVLGGEEEWSPLPDYLKGATLLRPGTGNSLHFTAKENVQAIVAASWAYDGNQSGGWFASRASLPQLVQQGWQPVGSISLKEKGAYTLLRRQLKAGEQVKFHTRKYNPPVLFLPTAANGKAVASLEVLATPSSDLSHIKPPRRAAAETAKAVLLRTHEPDPQDRFAERGVLLRELVRQAILVAAREELGLATRDETLRERWEEGPAEGPLPLDVVVRVQEDHRVSISLFRSQGDNRELLFDREFILPEGDLVLALTTQSEVLSRQEFVVGLKKAGFSGKANARAEEKEVRPEVAATPMHMVQQFVAARQLHQLIREDGESPERLAALAQIYSHLGMLSEHHWYQGHKAFKARALLYSQRAVVLWPKSAAAMYSRAYVRALVGLHQAALDDLSVAAKLEEGAKPPAWASAIESYCRFDLPALDKLAAEPGSLARWLRLLAQERYGATKSILTAAKGVLEEVRDSDRAIECVYEIGQLGPRGTAARQGLERTAEMLMRRLAEVPKLPDAAGKVVREELAARSGDEFDAAAEHQRRTAVTRALRDEDKTALDVGEPSWQALATVIEEISFVQVERNLEFLATGLSVSLDDTQLELAPLVADHPYRRFIESFCDDLALRRQRLSQLNAVLRPQDLSLNEDFILTCLDKQDFPGVERLGSMVMRHQDIVYRDLLQTADYSRELFWKEYAGHLRRVSPHSTLTIATSVEIDWEFAEPRAAQWEKDYAKSPHVLLALGEQYLKHEKYADAVRCLEPAIRLMPEYRSYAALASAWEKQKDEKKWQETWDRFLEEEDYGLTHAKARVKVAEHFMQQKRWKEALPYAEAAADTGAAWAMRCAADCLSGLKRHAEAEELMQAVAQRYDAATLWYFWCRRTGQGDLVAARKEVRAALMAGQILLDDPEPLAFLVLEGEKEEALKHYHASLVKEGSPMYGWMASLLNDEQKQPKNRDAGLKIVIENGNKPKYERKYLVELAKLAQEALADPAKLEQLPGQADALLAKIDDPQERCVVAYLAGKFLDLRGKPTEGLALLKQAADSPFTTPASALAVAELQARKKDDGLKNGEKK